MPSLISKQNLDFMPKPNRYQLVLDDMLPSQELITAVFGLIFDEELFLMTQLNKRGWDIPGGHIEAGELPIDAVIREIFEETATRVKNLQIFAYERFELQGAIPESYKYPCPISYQLFYLGQVMMMEDFSPTNEAHARKLFTPEEVGRTAWGRRGMILYEAALTAIREQKDVGSTSQI